MLASRSVPQPTKRGLRPERQMIMSASLPSAGDDRLVFCTIWTNPLEARNPNGTVVSRLAAQ